MTVPFRLALVVLCVLTGPLRADFWIRMPEIDPIPGAPGSGSPLLNRLYDVEEDKKTEKKDPFVQYVSGGPGRLDTGENDENAGPKAMREAIFAWPEYDGPPPVVWDLKEHYVIHKMTTAADGGTKGQTEAERLTQVDLERDMVIMSAWYLKYTRGPMKLSGAVIKAPPVPLINQRDLATRLMLQGRGGVRLALILLESSAGSLRDKSYDTGLQVLRDLFGVDHGGDLAAWNEKVIRPWMAGEFKPETDWPARMREMIDKGVRPGHLRDVIRDKEVPETVRDWAISLSGVTRRRECSPVLQEMFFDSDDDRRELIAIAMLKIADPGSEKFLKKMVKGLPKHAKHIGVMARAAVDDKMHRALVDIADRAFGHFEIKEGQVECLRYLRRYDLVHLMARSENRQARQDLWKRILAFKILDSRWSQTNFVAMGQDNNTMPPQQSGGTSHLMARALLELRIGDKVLGAKEVQRGLEELIGVAFNEVKIPPKNQAVKDRRKIGSPLAMACLCRLYGLDRDKAVSVLKYILKTDGGKTHKWDERILEVARELTK